MLPDQTWPLLLWRLRLSRSTSQSRHRRVRKSRLQRLMPLRSMLQRPLKLLRMLTPLKLMKLLRPLKPLKLMKLSRPLKMMRLLSPLKMM